MVTTALPDLLHRMEMLFMSKAATNETECADMAADCLKLLVEEDALWPSLACEVADMAYARRVPLDTVLPGEPDE